MYANPGATTQAKLPSVTTSGETTVVVCVIYLSPDSPVNPVGPVDPVGPVNPLGPTGPGTPGVPGMPELQQVLHDSEPAYRPKCLQLETDIVILRH